MTDYTAELYGHPRQIQPSHIVITSPDFDTREVIGGNASRHHGRRCKREEAPLESIFRMRSEGKSYKTIAEVLELSWSAVRRWCMEEAEEQKRIIAEGER